MEAELGLSSAEAEAKTRWLSSVDAEAVPGSGVSVVEAEAASWIASHKEIADMNQYWYSPATISKMVRVIRRHCIGDTGDAKAPLDCAFVSTPSIFFALEKAERANSRVLDYDRQLGTEEEGMFFYDFNEPAENLPAEMKGAFRSVVIDPPFITRDVWEKYAESARWLLAPGGLIIATTVAENAPMMAELLGVRPNQFLPSIPNLPYQYAMYTSFDAPDLDAVNAEVPVDPAELLRSAQAGYEANKARASEAPVRGKGNGAYDFEAMLEAAMKNGAHP
ncbi:putative N6-adenine methyltransferase-domain-containing protein [Pavlovales sp. CCMP2436]|nr:putative N6-adenine methyltransferase-domain-containing protein [Pavlovales sp. CCMP2436]